MVEPLICADIVQYLPWSEIVPGGGIAVRTEKRLPVLEFPIKGLETV